MQRGFRPVSEVGAVIRPGECAASLGQNAILAELEMLGQVTDPVMFGHHDLPAIWPLGSEKEPKQRGLAVAIAADKSEPLARIHQKVDVIQQ